MGLCSTPDPAGLLRHLGTLLDPEDGRVWLLEHGRSYYGWVNWVLDRMAGKQAELHGCWWNRDVGQVLEKSGLEIVEIRRTQLGTVWWVQMKRGVEGGQPGIERRNV